MYAEVVLRHLTCFESFKGGLKLGTEICLLQA